ncbi:hypothetical protein [Dactylosporangium sp. CA-092794]
MITSTPRGRAADRLDLASCRLDALAEHATAVTAERANANHTPLEGSPA